MKRLTSFVALSLLLVLSCAGVSEAQIFGCEGVPFNGAITLADLTQTNRLFRDGVPDTCAAPGSCGTPLAGTYHYRVHTFRNYGLVAACVIVNVDTACTGTNFIMPPATSVVSTLPTSARTTSPASAPALHRQPR